MILPPFISSNEFHVQLFHYNFLGHVLHIMPRPYLKRPSEPGFLGSEILRRFRRTEARRRQSQQLATLRTKYRDKVIQERKTRAQLQELEDRIKRLENILNLRRAFDFTEIFQNQSINEDDEASSLPKFCAYFQISICEST